MNGTFLILLILILLGPLRPYLLEYGRWRFSLPMIGGVIFGVFFAGLLLIHGAPGWLALLAPIVWSFAALDICHRGGGRS